MKELPQARGYCILKPLGSGGMGNVFVGEKLTTHQAYAIKFLREDLVRDAVYLARFERELNALLAIRHPHVVNVFDWWFPPPGEPGKPFVVMELLEGEGLDARLRGHRDLSPREAINVMLQTLDGLSATHRLGVIHRDLGPSNIFLSPGPSGRVLAKILDFGLVRPSTPGNEDGANISGPGALMGKPGYVAPEMLLDEPLDERSDIFGCGILLYRMLAGRLPFINTQQQPLWVERFTDARQGKEIVPLRRYAPGAPLELEAIVARAVRFRPAERYPTAEEMQVDLLAFEPEATSRREDGAAPTAAPSEGEPPSGWMAGATWMDGRADDGPPIELETIDVAPGSEASSRAPSFHSSSVSSSIHSRPGSLALARMPQRPPAAKPFPVAIVAALLVLFLVAAAAVYYFFLRDAPQSTASRVPDVAPMGTAVEFEAASDAGPDTDAAPDAGPTEAAEAAPAGEAASSGTAP
jgi:serine/threonine-protein kinase